MLSEYMHTHKEVMKIAVSLLLTMKSKHLSSAFVGTASTNRYFMTAAMVIEQCIVACYLRSLIDVS